MKISKLTGVGIHVADNKTNIKPPVNFYSLKATSNSGEQISFEKYRGKKVLIVNLASECGFTPQYAELEQLHQHNKNISVLGFRSNNFGGRSPAVTRKSRSFAG